MERQQQHKCRMCGETFSSDEELEAHNGRVHGSGKSGGKEEEEKSKLE